MSLVTLAMAAVVTNKKAKNTELWRHFGFQADEDGSIVMNEKVVESVGWKCSTLAARQT